MNQKFYFVVSKIPSEIKEKLRTQEFNVFSDLYFSKYSYLWGSHEWAWLIQTFLQLKQAGLDVELVEHPVPDSICITHFVTTKNKVWRPDTFIVGIRSDTPPMRMLDFEIVQSPAVVGKENSSVICHWPQANLKPRHKKRKNKIETISYFGGVGGISPNFYSNDFRRRLNDINVSLHLNFSTDKWGDYSETDLVMAIRSHHHPSLIRTKPASKLINAWQAGCVALLGPEPAYQAIGENGKTYFEIKSPQDVLNVIKKCQENHKLFESVREAGEKKYTEYSFDAIRQQWIDLLTGPVTIAFQTWKASPRRNSFSGHLLRNCQAARQWIDHKSFSIPIRSRELMENFKNS